MHIGSLTETTIPSLADELKRLADPSGRIKPCRIGRLLEDLDKETSMALRGNIGDHQIQVESIRKVLAGNKFRIGWHTINNHRQGFCSCPEDTK